MPSDKAAYKIPPTPVEAGRLTLTPYYLVGIISTTIGIVMAGIFNFFTPLESIQKVILGPGQAISWGVFLGFVLPKIIFMLAASYCAVIYMTRQILSPISECIRLYKNGEIPDENQIKKAQRRLLNIHFIFVPINVGVWILIPGIVGLFAYLAGISEFRTAVTLACRASMVGLIASAIASQWVEAVSRIQLIPFFFPDGRLTGIEGAAKLSISKRIVLVNRLGAIVPVTILLVTLLTLQWEMEADSVSAVEYGRSIILFTFVLFIYTLISSKQLNRILSRNIIEPINDLVRVLQKVQKGHYTDQVRVVSNDEIGYAGEVVNEMTLGLEERQRMQKSLDLAAEIQQNLLPGKIPDIPGLDVSGTSLYCDETGGDYYDFIWPDKDRNPKIRMVLGDVSGHGISSALLMATSRALFRQRSAMAGDLAQVVSDVNRQLCSDVKESGNFITLFAIELDSIEKSLKWIRAGHDPAMIYHCSNDTFSSLKGSGIALGVDEEFEYEENRISGISKGDIIALYTDGIWEAKNEAGDQFGKESLENIIRENASGTSEEISKQVMDAISRFQKNEKLQDDATLVIVKAL